MYIALNNWVNGGKLNAYEFIDWAAAKGLDGVELTVGDQLPIDIAGAECRRIAEHAKRKKVGLRTLASGSGWGCSLGAADAAERKQAADFLRKYIQIAQWIGAETVLVVPGATRISFEAGHPELPYRLVWDNVTAEVKKLVPFIEEHQVNVGLENVWNRFLISPMEWKLFLDQFKSDYVGIYFDAGNACIYGRAHDYPDLLGKYLKAVHLKNFQEQNSGGTLFDFTTDLFEGDLDYKALWQALQKVGYKGAMTVEMIPFSGKFTLGPDDKTLADKMARQILELKARLA